MDIQSIARESWNRITRYGTPQGLYPRKECPNCKEYAISGGDVRLPSGKMGCYCCLPESSKEKTSSNGLHLGADNPFHRSKEYTRAKDEVLMNQAPHPDDPGVIIDKRTGKEAEF